MKYVLFYGIQIPDTDLVKAKENIDKIYVEWYSSVVGKYKLGEHRNERDLCISKLSEVACNRGIYCFHYGSYNLDFSFCLPFCMNTKTVSEQQIDDELNNLRSDIANTPARFLDSYREYLNNSLLKEIDEEMTNNKWKFDFHVLPDGIE